MASDRTRTSAPDHRPAPLHRAPAPGGTFPPPRWATAAAHAVSLIVLPSSLWRIALVLGFPAGYTAEGFVPFQTLYAQLAMVLLSAASEFIVLLTFGLVRPWGETAPRWIPLIGGRRVHPLAATVPALLGALGLTWIWSDLPWWWTYPHDDMTSTGGLVVGLLYLPMVLWGPLTAALAVSYWRRRRHG
ncbi:hypothetical protein [Streptomyces bambusae]|uniref:hypothetical protein n=1 Tax=Streptomyces bambusae TaxID=1550616 RepID=UPI002155AA7B|nr:hypothetical protein [Streptomyces bambusae]